LYQRAPGELVNVLKALGYYQPTISSQLERKADVTHAIFTIELGKPVTVRTIDIVVSGAGKDLPVWQQFRQFQLVLRPQAIFTHEDYSRTVSALSNVAVNEGYIDAAYTVREFKVYPHLQAVDIHLHLDTQAAYQFGQVRFHGSKQVSDAFLNRYVNFAPGDTYRQSDINTLQRALIDSEYFGLIRVAPQHGVLQNRRIPIDVELEDSLKHRYELGGGYGTDTGARLVFNFENRWVNQHGHSYQVNSLFGENAQNFNFNYRIPGERPATQHWNIGAKFDATQSDILSRSLGAMSANYHYQIDPKWAVNPFVSLENERFRYKGEPLVDAQTLLVGSHLKHRWVNSESYPTDGFNHNATVRSSIDNWVSESQFIQLELNVRHVFSLAEFWRLHAGLQTKFTFSEPNQVIPATYLSLLGGEKLRGYAFESVGIEAEDGSISGAKNSLLGSVETDYRITQYVGAGLFADFGQVFDDTRAEEWKVGAGVGLRGYTPVGMAKLDVAWPVSEVESSAWRIHFSLGFDL
jgi:translocation and assembly module TamA